MKESGYVSLSAKHTNPPKFVPTDGYISKRIFLHNRPQLSQIPVCQSRIGQTVELPKLSLRLDGTPCKTNCFHAMCSSPFTLLTPVPSRSVPQWPLLSRQLQRDPAPGLRLRRPHVRQLVPNGAGGVPPRAEADQPQGQSHDLCCEAW